MFEKNVPCGEFCVQNSAVDYPSFGRVLVMAYDLVAHCRDSKGGEKRGMAKGMTAIDCPREECWGNDCVPGCEGAGERGVGLESMKAGDLFALRKTRTATDSSS